MRISLAVIGKLKDGPDQQLFARYWQRLQASGRTVGLGPLELIELPEGRSDDVARRKGDEALRLGKAIGGADYRIVLDEGGRAMSSTAFARLLQRQIEDGCKSAAFMIGGPDGHDGTLLSDAHVRLSLGPMTLPHGLARIVLAEQLYRAATILAGHPYHRD